MKSRGAFLDLAEVAARISAQLKKEGSAVSDGLVLRILHLETQFMSMVNLTRPGSTDREQGGHLYREGCWVVERTARTEPQQEEVR